MNGTNLELNFQLDIYRSKSWKFTKIYITILETSRLLLADIINVIAQVQNEIGADNSSKENAIKKKFDTVPK
ncbi:putative nuclease HARBI1, partial [Aphis craccivora]